MATRASLSITEPNERWIQEQIDSKEFSSRSEVINDLIRGAREVEAIRARLVAAEVALAHRGQIDKTPKEVLDGFKEEAREDGTL